MCRPNNEILVLNSLILRDMLLITMNHYNYNQKNHVSDCGYEDQGNNQINNFK